MSTASPTPSDPAFPDAAPDWERALLDRQLEALGRLAEMGMAVAGAIEARVTAGAAEAEPVQVLHHAAVDFARVSRAVRLSFALQSKLIADFKGVGRPRTGRAGANDDDEEDDHGRGPIEVVWLEPEEDPRAVQRRRVQAAVRERAEAEALDREAVERLALQAGERLDGEPLRAQLFTRPFEEIVALICQALGLAPPVPEAADGTQAPTAFDLHAAPP